MKKLALALGLVIAFGASAEVKVFTPEKGGIPNMEYAWNDAPTVTVVQYNMAAARVGTIDDLAKAIATLDADIISLNEVDNMTERSGKVNQVEALAKKLNMHYAFGRAIDFEGGQYGVAVLSKYEIAKTQVVNLPSGNDEQRVLLASEIAVPGFDSPILFMNTHLDWHEDHVLQAQQVTEINNIVVANTEMDFPELPSRIKILAGDFNDVYNGPALKELSRYWNLVTDEDQNEMRTWPAANPHFDLDHILTSRGQVWHVEDVKVPEVVEGDINWGTTSDHLPVVAKLKLLEQ